ncbi:hypothetical protein Tco_1281287 [Tanacetum coccineum]
MALMAFSDSEIYNDKTCSKTCLKNFKTLKKQCDDLIVKLNQTKFTATTYKRGLATLEEQLITYRKNEVLFSEEVAVLKREVTCKDYEINVLKSEFEKVKQEKVGIEFKIKKFNKASKDLNQLSKKLDLSYSGLDEFKEPEFKGYGLENSKQESNIVCDKKSDNSKENSDNSLVKEQVSKDTSSFVESLLNVNKETVFPVDKKDKSQQDDTKFVDSRCSRHMTGNVMEVMLHLEEEHMVVEFLVENYYCQAKVTTVGRQKSKTSRNVKRGRDTKIPQSSSPPEKVGDEAVYKELGDIMERVVTTDSSLEVEHDNGNIK